MNAFNKKYSQNNARQIYINAKIEQNIIKIAKSIPNHKEIL